MKFIILLVLCSVLSFIGCLAETPSDELSTKPRNVKIKTTSETSIRVTWDAPPKSEKSEDIWGYYIFFEPDGGYMDYSQYDCLDAKCSFEIRDLNENRQYTISVQAKNKAGYGMGDMSDKVRQYTDEGLPDRHRVDIECNALSSEELRVSWKSPPLDSLHGNLKEYKITYAPNHLFDDKEKREHKTVLDNEIVLQGLKKNMNYAIRISATNSVGAGPPSSKIECSTQTDVPDKPVDIKAIVKGTDKVLVLWHPPLETNGEILSYTVYYRKKGSEPKTRETLATKTSYEISGLERDKTYVFWVTGSTKDGEGPASNFITKVTSENISPQIVTYGEQITVKFNTSIIELSCAAFGSPEIRFTWKVNGDNLDLGERMFASYGKLFIDNVVREDAKNYTCIVENEFGSDSITHQLIVEAPPKAPEITILNTTTDEIVLQLKKNSTDSAPINGFNLYYKLDSEIKQWENQKFHFTSELTFTISDCKCGSPYLIYATGHNHLGDGEPSEMKTVKTNGSKPSATDMADFIEPSAESAILHLGSWNENSCPILYFFVSFKKKQDSVWTDVRNKLRPNTDFILNLESATEYEIRVTAYNVAGSTLAEYEFATLSKDLVTIAPPSDNDSSNANKTIKVIGTN